MTKKSEGQLEFESSIYSQPDGDIRPNARKLQATKPSRHTSKASDKAKQPSLPGLSRRGRPRAENPVPATVRASESRKRRLDTGVKRIELLLEPHIAADLEWLLSHFKTSRAEIIGRLISQAARRRRALPKQRPHPLKH
jgi:hypothetical protein